MHLLDNILYKIVALLIAALLWAAAQGVTDAEESLDLPVHVENVPEDLVIVDQSAHEINLRLTGSRAALRNARKELLRYPVSLAGVKRGEASFAVSTEQLSLPRGAYVAARSPSTIVFQTEPVETKKVPVRADVFGTPPGGVRIKGVRVEPAQVDLEGARNSVRKVREVLTDRVDVSRVRETTTIDSQLVPPAVPYVWAKNGNGMPIKVHVEVESVEPAGEGAE